MESIKDNMLKREPLTTKKAAEFLLDGTLKTKVCKYCLNISYPLFELDQFMQIAGEGQEIIYKVTIRDMISCFYPFQSFNDSNLPNKICNKCLNRTISSYLFTQQCERANRAILNCFIDIDEKFDKLDSLDKPKKRGRQKLNPNYNTIYTEHKRVIDYAEPIINIVNSGSEFIDKNVEPKMGILECPKCWQVLPNMESMLNHAKLHPKSMWCHCRICGKSFPKRTQFKKHIHSSHTLDNDLSLENTEISNFTCNNCGVTNDNYIEHLQHVEKHKFKEALKHIVEKKVDNLCTICLNKSVKLTNLDKLICIHGGCPELTGDRTLYNILASTIPDRKTYKYQELHVPYKAHIMRVIKKNKNQDLNLNIQEKSQAAMLTDVNLKKKFIFTLPDVVSEDMTDSNNICIYVFSKPNEPEKCEVENYQSFKSTTDSELLSANNTISNNAGVVSLKMNEGNKVKGDIQSILKKVSTMLPKLNPVEEDLPAIKTINDDYKKPLKSTKSQMCKVCWVFNKPTCTECKRIENAKNTDKEKESHIADNIMLADDTINSCKSCWIFEKSKKCVYCSKPTNKCYYQKSAHSNSEEYNENIQTRKRKIIYEDEEPKAKKRDWQCNVCLTNNDTKRETCVCCDSIRNVNDMTAKVNVDLNTTNIFRIKKVEAVSTEIVADKSINLPPFTPKKETIEIVLNVDKIKENNVDKEQKIIDEVNTFNKISSSIIQTEKEKSHDDTMEIEIIPEYDNKVKICNDIAKEVVEEEMDIISEEEKIEEENMSQSIEIFSLSSSLCYTANAPTSSQQTTENMTCENIQTPSLQFTIGSTKNTTRNVKKYKRRLRAN